MATSVTLPALGESVTEGTVTRWLKQVGDEISADEPLLEVSTDKVDTEIPSPAAGTLLEIKVAEDETVEVGTELAVIGMPDETAAARGDGGGAERPAERAPAEEPLLETPSPARDNAGGGQQQPRTEPQAPQEPAE
ncbi:MAG: biotin/lipoyl-containing protein, partial [Polyangiales bacterium]